MESDWKEFLLGEIASFAYGKMPQKELLGKGIYPTFSGYKYQYRYPETNCNKGDVIIVARGVGGTGDIKIVKERCYLTNLSIRLTFDQNVVYNAYFYYKYLKQTLRYLDSGSAQSQITINDLQREALALPPLPEQRAIARILGSLDDKIELNRRMNETLEGMAQALFKSWFVDFDPVIDNAIVAGNPIPEELADRAEVRRAALANGTANREAAKPFPGVFQQTEELGWIPESWEMNSFAKLATLDTTSVKPFQHPETLWEHYSIPSFDSSGIPCWESGSEIKSNKYLVKPGSILTSKLNPETERTWWPFLIHEETSICSTEFMQFVPLRIEEQAFIYSLIRSQPFQDNILERVTGSTGSRQRAQPQQIAEIDVIDCGETLRTMYVAVSKPMFQSTRNNLIQSRELTKLRDTLLPKLISGELRIPDAEKLADAALA